MLLSSVISFFLFTGVPPKETHKDSLVLNESGLVFRWDKTNYDENYLSNSKVAANLCSLLEEIGYENIDSVSVVAYASPEGVYEHNMMLSRRRAAEFDRAIRERLGLGSGVRINVRPGGEAWDLLRSRVAADTVMSSVARDRVLKILDDDSIGRDTKKWRMMHNALGATRQEGDVYHYLLLHHYVYLRCLSVNIYMREKPAEEYREEGAEQTAPPDYDEAVGKEDAPVSGEPVKDHEPAAGPEPGTEIIAPHIIPESKLWKPVIGLSTNLVYDAAFLPGYGFTSIPSFSLEYYPDRGRYTFGADLDLSHWSHPGEHRYNQIHNLTLWGRRYFKPSEVRFDGLYLLGSVNAAEYGLGWDERGWEGEGLGLSAGIGHKWTFGRAFIDLGLSAGLFFSRYDPYVWGNDATLRYYYDYSGDPADFTRRRMLLSWFGPTRVYLSIGIDLFNRKK